jgi:hypothetical protein
MISRLKEKSDVATNSGQCFAACFLDLRFCYSWFVVDGRQHLHVLFNKALINKAAHELFYSIGEFCTVAVVRLELISLLNW